jgi:outer membrane lipoprotein-sorting protein
MVVTLRKHLAAIAFLLVVAHIPQSGSAAAEDDEARRILEKADQIRFPRDAFEVDVSISTSAPGQSAEARKYRVLSKGNANTLVMITEPASERGQIMLMKDRDLWIFLPSVSQPVRLSLGQRLTGQVANGDLARSNFSGDYTPKILRNEVVDGENHVVLELAAVDRSITYNKVVYWVKQSNFRPHRAEFYSVSNRLLKTCRYENFQTMLGTMRPTRLVMEDALRKGEESVLEYSAMKLRDLPDKIFTKEHLNKLQ